MAPSTRKTQPSSADVNAVLAAVIDERRRADAEQVTDLMQSLCGVEPVLWGSAIIGFGHQPYTTADGKEHDWFAVGLSPRKAALTLYGLTYYGSNEEILSRLGPHTTGKGCLYIKRLDAVDLTVLAELITTSWQAQQHSK